MAIYHPAGGQTYTLQSSISSSQTSITLTSFLLPVSGTPITMALMNTDIAYGTIAPKTNQSEFISFTGITQNADGTALLTGVNRGLSRVDPFGNDSAYQLPHAGATQFILSDAPQVFNEFTAKVNDEEIDGDWAFTTRSPSIPTESSSEVNRAASIEYVNNTTTAGAPDASNTVKGITKLSVAAASPTNPIAVGDNDGRVPTQAENDALVGNNTDIAVGSGNKFVTQTGFIHGAETYAASTGSSTNTISGNPTITIASPAVITLSSHGLVIGDPVKFTTSGSLPTGIVSGTTYYVISAGFTANSFEIAATPGGTAINTSGSQSGTHTAARPANTYEVALSPVVTSLTAGMTVKMKANFTNTDAAFVNVNNLGGILIKKQNGSTAIASGDIVSGMVIILSYDGTFWQMETPIANIPTATYFSTTGSKDASDASTTQTFAHGFGRTPKYARITAQVSRTGGDSALLLATTTYNGTTQSSMSTYMTGATSNTTAATFTLNAALAAATQSGVVTMDATNIIITWTKTGSPTGVYTLLVEAFNFG